MKIKMNCAMLALCLTSPVALADKTINNVDLLETIELMQKQIHQLEGQVSTLTPVEQNSGWFNKVKISGVVEIEAGHVAPFEGSDESDIVLATVELAMDVSVNDWAGVQIVVLHEDDDTEPWEIDQGVTTIGNTDKHPVYFSVGRMYLPFGNFTSNMVSDSLTLEIAETREAAIQLVYQSSGVYASVFVFNGDTTTGDDSIEHFGGNLGLIQEAGWGDFEADVSYINNIADSDSIQVYLAAIGNTTIADNISAWSSYGLFYIGDFIFIAEYVSAIDDFRATEIPFNNKGATLASANLELGYNFSMFGKDSIFALAYQEMQQGLSLGLPKQRVLVALSAAIDDTTTPSFEWAHDNDYKTSNIGIDDAGDVLTGTGNSADTVTFQLAVGF